MKSYPGRTRSSTSPKQQPGDFQFPLPVPANDNRPYQSPPVPANDNFVRQKRYKLPRPRGVPWFGLAELIAERVFPTPDGRFDHTGYSRVACPFGGNYPEHNLGANRVCVSAPAYLNPGTPGNAAYVSLYNFGPTHPLFGWPQSLVVARYTRVDPAQTQDGVAGHAPRTVPGSGAVPVEWIYPGWSPIRTPILTPMPSPKPVPFPWLGLRPQGATREGRDTGNDLYGDPVFNRQPRPVPRRQPKKGEKERKVKTRVPGAVLYLQKVGHAVTEYLDFLDAFWKGLPPAMRRGKSGWSPQQKALFIYQNQQHLDVNKVFQEMVTNQIEDAILGGANRAAKQFANQIGVTIGPYGLKALGR